MPDGKVLATCAPRDRHREFPRFLRLVDTAEGLDLNRIVYNYAKYKTLTAKRWLKAHPPLHLHITPTSWLSMVERFLADITGAAPPKASPSRKAPSCNTWGIIMPPPNARLDEVRRPMLEHVARAKQALESQH